MRTSLYHCMTFMSNKCSKTVTIHCVFASHIEHVLTMCQNFLLHRTISVCQNIASIFSLCLLVCLQNSVQFLYFIMSFSTLLKQKNARNVSYNVHLPYFLVYRGLLRIEASLEQRPGVFRTHLAIEAGPHIEAGCHALCHNFGALCSVLRLIRQYRAGGSKKAMIGDFSLIFISMVTGSHVQKEFYCGSISGSILR